MDQPAGKKLHITKYPNRRYYDATHSRHFTLQEIREMIQQGYDIEVVEAKSGKEITGQVLTQIILELDTPKLDALPVPLLLRIIRMNDLLIKDFIEKYFNQALKSFFEYQHQFEEQMRRAQGLPSSFPPVSSWTKAMLQPFANVFGEAPAAGAPGTADAGLQERENLRQTVEALQRQVAKLKQKRPKPAKRLRKRKR